MSQIPQLRSELVKAAGRTYQPAAQSAHRRSGVWGTAAAAAVALVAVTVVVVVVALAGHHARQLGTNTSSEAHRTSVQRLDTSQKALVDELAPLRRPQTQRDLDPSLLVVYLGPRGAFETRNQIPYKRAAHTRAVLQRNLARVVPVPGVRGRLLIAPSTYAPSGATNRPLQGINILLDAAGSDFAATGPVPTSVAAFEQHGLGVSSVSRVGATTFAHVAELLPDGVKTLRLTDFKKVRNASAETNPALKVPAGTNQGLHGLHAQVSVQNNVAGFRLPIPTVDAGPRNRARLPDQTKLPVDTIAHATWLGAHDRVLRQTTTDLQIVVRLHYRGS